MRQILILLIALLCYTYVYSQDNKTEKLDSVVVKASKSRVLRATQISAVSMPISTVFSMPATLGEPDILKSLQMIPGVVGAGDGNVALHIRGGSSSQNLFVADGAILYNPEHFKGYVSAFNSVAVQDVLLYKGGFPVQYGNRLSGVVDVELKRGDFQTYHGTLNLGLFAASGMINGPIIKDKLSFMVSARKSYFDQITTRIINIFYNKDVADEINKENSIIPFSNVKFFDFNTKLSYKPNSRNILDFSFYKGKDIDEMGVSTSSVEDGFNDRVIISTKDNENERWGNMLAIVNWDYTGNKIKVNTKAFYSQYNYNDAFNDILQSTRYIKPSLNLYSYDKYTRSTSYKVKVKRVQLSNINTIPDGLFKGISFGADIAHMTYAPSYSIIEISENYSNDTLTSNILSATIKDGNRTLITGSVFANYNFKLGKVAEFDVGIRGSAHITDGKTYFYPEPRANAVLHISNKLALKAAYSFMVQSEHKISTADFLEDADMWMPSNKDIKPSTSQQIAAGLFYDLKNEGGWAMSLEAYYKDMNDILEYKEGAFSAVNSKEWEERVAVGKGWSYGLEFLLQKNKGRTTGWVSYTWSKSIEKFNRPGQIINTGLSFYAPHDCRHSATLNMTHKLNDHFDFSATFAYHTGRYRTLYNLHYTFNPDRDFNDIEDWDTYTLNVAHKRNNIKINDYHKLDIVFTYHTEHKIGSSAINFGITNVYNNFNISYVNGYHPLQKVCLFPIMPTFSYSYSF